MATKLLLHTRNSPAVAAARNFLEGLTRLRKPCRSLDFAASGS